MPRANRFSLRLRLAHHPPLSFINGGIQELSAPEEFAFGFC